MRNGFKIALWVIIPFVFLAALFWLRVLQLNGAFRPTPVASNPPPVNTDPYLNIPIPDPDSDVLFGGDNADISVIRYSPTKGFWAREDKVSRSIGGFNLDGGHYMFAVGGPFSDELVAVDLEWARPWAAASVTQLGGISHGTSFDSLNHRYFILTVGKVFAFHVQGPNFRQINSVSVNINADWIIAGGGRFVFTCPGLDAMSCREFEVDSESGALSPDAGRELKLASIPHRLFSTPDGRFLILPEERFGVHRPPEYRLNPQGKLSPVPGTGEEIPDSGYFWIYRLKADGSILSVRGSPFRSQHLPSSITLSLDGRFIYAGYSIYGVRDGEGIDVYSLSPETGELTLVPDAVPCTRGDENPKTIIFGQDESRAYGDTRNAQVIAFDADPKTGHLTFRARAFLWPHLRWALSAPGPASH